MGRFKYLSIFLFLTLLFWQDILPAQAQGTLATDKEIENIVTDYLAKFIPNYEYEIMGVSVRADKTRHIFKYAPKSRQYGRPMVLDFYSGVSQDEWDKNKFWQIYDCPPDLERMQGYAQVRVYKKGMDFKCWVSDENKVVIGPRMAIFALKEIPDSKFGVKMPFDNTMIFLQNNMKADYDKAQRVYVFKNMGWKESDGQKYFTVYQVKIYEDSGFISPVSELKLSLSPQMAFEKIFPAALESIKSIHPNFQLSFIYWDFEEDTYRMLIDYRPEADTIDHWRLFLGINAADGKVVSSQHGLYLSSDSVRR